jgi:hypothetical protein
MKKILPILIVSILVLSGLGAVAIPNEKQIVNKSLSTQDFGVKFVNNPIAETIVLAPNSTFFTTPAFQSYTTHRQTQGQKIISVSLEHLGNPDADQIRDFLKTSYLDGNRRTLLIVGDETVIPSKYCYDFEAVGKMWDAYSDYYYGDLEGDWDVNNDQRYGEFLKDSVDFKDPEFIVGRLPVIHPYESDEILNRTMKYEKETASWKENMLLAAGTISKQGDASLVMFRIDNILSRRNYPVTTMTDKGFFRFIKPDIELNETSFRKTWKEGKFGFIYTISHGSPTGLYYYAWQYFSISDVDDLNPGYPGIYISLGCNNNQPYLGETLGKALIKKRMVAAVGSTTVTDPGYYLISGPWAECFFPRMYLLNNYDLGTSMHITKVLYYLMFLQFNKIQKIGFGLQTNLLAFTIYGDPLIKQF